MARPRSRHVSTSAHIASWRYVGSETAVPDSAGYPQGVSPCVASGFPVRATVGPEAEAHRRRPSPKGLIGPEHIRTIRNFFDHLPDAIDVTTREHAEATLAKIATEQLPDGLRNAAARLLALLHPDGDFTDADRARRRGITVSPQGPEGLSKVHGLLDPEGRATCDAMMAAWATRGKCNPDDPTPCIDGDPGEKAGTDQRTLAQRQHDALTAVGRAILASGQLGSHHGLPATIIVSTTLQELQSAAGYAVTGGGTLLPMRDVIRLASHAHHYFVVYDKHTREALYFGRTKRCASPGQRIVLYSLHGGCTKPGCHVPPYGCEVHHAARDWKRGGQTNIDELTLACKPDNLLVENTGWTTRIRKDGRTNHDEPEDDEPEQIRPSRLPSADRARRRRPAVGRGRSGPAGRHGAAPVRRSRPRRRAPPRRR